MLEAGPAPSTVVVVQTKLLTLRSGCDPACSAIIQWKSLESVEIGG
jgi:hypothetical protein